MAAHNAKRSIWIILRKNRGLWTVYNEIFSTNFVRKCVEIKVENFCGLRVKNVRYRGRAVALSGFVKSLKQDWMDDCRPRNGHSPKWWPIRERIKGLSTLGTREPVPGCRHKMLLCSHFKYLVCDCVHNYRIYSINRPGRLLNFWSLRVGAY